GRPRTTSFAE
nr:Chain C, Glycogen Synthase Kinase-3 Beta [Homo sapiens]1O6L_C Chain C, Glycogen Synthase Kinase-3 Beta [Homo sapiens]2JDO_C Chain C, Glycogen Synthase Kinase-3 Beta [Homo sapiens]2JDR_C Chain C, Glycogen Synthase Kinase-3 Beta [Homo sapiens]2UW9_C Chain C, Glycogen Synthase Kinase-3 Beta [Homo sapiens]2X39_C Chain C, Glycogen Synthase Kinase-3 Beta [Homo sapiens]2XH5_C Chain C, GLYCOGEN SYNTHASE KINASE-3 BETA [Homo sapiens]3CQU_C Chain C, Glycogen synthase kinase-3 beta [Homo sapiens]3CQ